MSDPRILLVTPHAGYEQRIRQAYEATLNGELRRVDVTTADEQTAGSLARHLDPTLEVVAIGPGLEVTDALALARAIEDERPEISVLLVGKPTPKVWQEALRAGVRDIILPDAPDAEVRGAIERAREIASRRRHNLVGEHDGPGSRGRIIAVLAPKGGSGKTTVAANLAVGLARHAPDQTVIVDLDVQFGDVATALRLSSDHSLVDAARGSGPLDVLSLKTFLAPHPTGMWALCSSEDPARADEVHPDRAAAVVEALADEFAYVVVDTCAGLTEHTLSLLEVATDYVFVCMMDVPSVRSLRKEIDALDALGMTTQQRHLVINRADSKVGLDVKDVEATVGIPVHVSIPSSRAVPLSINQGTPLLESDPRSPVAKQLGHLVQRFAAAPSERGGLLRRVKVDAR
jgi:pilus assembly protein CpaE